MNVDWSKRDPIELLTAWLEEAREQGQIEPTAMTLATVNEQGLPEARIVLLKGVDAHGLSFFTNYRSDKGQQLAQLPAAALVFFWNRLNRQVRISGTVKALQAAASDDYFSTRPRLSQIGAWASKQSQALSGPEELERRVAQLHKTYEGQPIPRPSHWGGYVLAPSSIEFWQGEDGRLHQRWRYTRSESGWAFGYLFP